MEKQVYITEEERAKCQKVADTIFVGKSKSLDFTTMLVFWSLVSLIRNSVVLAVYLLFSVACFFTIHEHLRPDYHFRIPQAD